MPAVRGPRRPRYSFAVPTKQPRRPQAPSRVAGAGPALRLDRVGKGYGARPVLREVSLAVDAGAVCLVVGANGAGKSTLLRLAAGLSRPDAGSVDACGTALYLRGTAGARAAQTVRQALYWARRLSRPRGNGAGFTVDEALASVSLGSSHHQRVATLSSGQRARLALAVALVCEPAVLCLDEPTGNLDAQGGDQARDVVAALALTGTAVLLATHQPDVFRRVADATVEVRDASVTTVRHDSGVHAAATG